MTSAGPRESLWVGLQSDGVRNPCGPSFSPTRGPVSCGSGFSHTPDANPCGSGFSRTPFSPDANPRGSGFSRTLFSNRLAVVYIAPVLVAAFAIGVALGQPLFQPEGETTMHADPAAAGLHDFDFLVGEWTIHHRRLNERLANCTDWTEFEGSSKSWKVMGGAALVDDNVVDLPDGHYRAVSMRAFDAKTGQWSIWWLDGRMPLGPLDPPVRGGFRDGVGTFLADEAFRGKPIKVRFTWSRITPSSARWEQAFSPDGGKTWETNWEMDFTRTK